MSHHHLEVTVGIIWNSHVYLVTSFIPVQKAKLNRSAFQVLFWKITFFSSQTNHMYLV